MREGWNGLEMEEAAKWQLVECRDGKYLEERFVDKQAYKGAQGMEKKEEEILLGAEKRSGQAAGNQIA
jgi:hypothetical protein